VICNIITAIVDIKIHMVAACLWWQTNFILAAARLYVLKTFENETLLACIKT